MKILLAHNFYGSSSPSGENVVFKAEEKLLKSYGHELVTVTRYSDKIRSKGIVGILTGALSTVWNPFAARFVSKQALSFQPDVFHAHNTFPLLSPAVFYAASKGAANVLTLHNYRLFCPAAIPMRNGQVCTQCIDRRTVWPAIRYGCYRASRLATLPLALSVALHRILRTWHRKIDAFIALSEFQRDLMAKAGLPKNKIFLKPNFYVGSPKVLPWETRGNYIVFVGRLSEEKGALTLLKAWRRWGTEAPELHIIGDGPLSDLLKSEAQNLPVRFLGRLPHDEAQAQIASARLLVLPSECYEGMPLVVVEAYAFGTPVAVSNLGPLPSIVHEGEHGVVFKSSDSNDLFKVVRTAWSNQTQLEEMGCAVRQEFEKKYTEEANHQQLMVIYQKAIANAAVRGVV